METVSNPEYQRTLKDMISGEHPHIEWLQHQHYLHYRVGSVYMNHIQKGWRLIFSYIPNAQGQRSLFILGATPHDYNDVRRWLKTTGITSVGSLELDVDFVDRTYLDPIDDSLPLELSNPQEKKSLAFLNTLQQQALSQTSGPAIYLGPAGSGKTLILDATMSRDWFHSTGNTHPAQPSSSSDSDAILFMSQSELLLESLRLEYEALPDIPVQFASWRSLLAKQFVGYQEFGHEAFKQWLSKGYSKETLDAERIHFELSLIVAYGEEAYKALQGERQSYYSGQDVQQKQCIGILKSWQKHLQESRAYDPMVSLPQSRVKTKIYCDEGQNFPPSALAYLIAHTQGSDFYITFDPEQSLTSPFSYAFIKQRLHSQYPEHKNPERYLEQTWRNSPQVVNTINQFMAQKHQWEGHQHKRPYSTITSAQHQGGHVTWVTDKSMDALKNHAQNASTAVITELPLDALAREHERQEIIRCLGTHQILDASMAIGMTFKTVILWKPLSQKAHIRTLLSSKAQSSLTLEQWIALNAIQIALGRAQNNVFIYEPNASFRKNGALCFGQLPTNALEPHRS